MKDKLKERGGAVPHQLRVGVELQSRGVRIPMQCPYTAKHQTVLVRKRQDKENKKKKQKKEDNKRMKPNREDGQKVSYVQDVKVGKYRGKSEQERQRRMEYLFRNISEPVKKANRWVRIH